MWVCNKCKSSNYDNLQYCAMCGTGRNEKKEPVTKGKSILIALFATIAVLLFAVFQLLNPISSSKSNDSVTISAPTLTPALTPSLTPTPTPSPTPTLDPKPTTLAPTPTPKPTPSAADLDAINANIKYPLKDSYYLNDYIYTTVIHGGCLAFLNPNANDVMAGNNTFVLSKGEKAVIIAESGNYACVIFPDLGKAGWINIDYLQES